MAQQQLKVQQFQQIVHRQGRAHAGKVKRHGSYTGFLTSVRDRASLPAGAIAAFYVQQVAHVHGACRVPERVLVEKQVEMGGHVLQFVAFKHVDGDHLTTFLRVDRGIVAVDILPCFPTVQFAPPATRTPPRRPGPRKPLGGIDVNVAPHHKKGMTKRL
ncbi:hypothetical protein EBZ80_13250 [bacterium]|nr:hypothetical protein [bacterium]